MEKSHSGLLSGGRENCSPFQFKAGLFCGQETSDQNWLCGLGGKNGVLLIPLKNTNHLIASVSPCFSLVYFSLHFGVVWASVWQDVIDWLHRSQMRNVSIYRWVDLRGQWCDDAITWMRINQGQTCSAAGLRTKDTAKIYGTLIA